MSAPKTGRRYCTFAHLSVNSSATAVFECHTLETQAMCFFSFAALVVLQVVVALVHPHCVFFHRQTSNRLVAVLVAFSQDNFSLFRFLHTLLSLQIFKNIVRHMKRGRNKHCGEWQKNHPFFYFICLVLEVMFPRTWKGRKLKTDPPTLESWSGSREVSECKEWGDAQQQSLTDRNSSVISSKIMGA